MKTVRKALGLLEHFTESQPEFGLTELAAVSGLDKATAHRMLAALVDGGFVEQDPQTRRYRLGVALLRLARIREACFPVLEVARPIIEALAAETGETAHFSSFSAGRLSTLFFVESSQGNRVGMENADTLPLHATASGLVFLAFAPEETVTAALAAKLQRFTPKTLVEPADIRVRLADVCRGGYATSDEGFEAGVFGLAGPVFDWFAAPMATVAVALPVARANPDALVRHKEAVLQAAGDLTRALGGRHPQAMTEAS